MSSGVLTARRLLLLLAMIALVLAGCGGRAPQAPVAPVAAASEPTSLPPVKADSRIIADGRVVPLRNADLSFATSGIVSEVLVNPGDKVAPGDLLVRLNGARQAASIAQAKADLQRALARLDNINAGSRMQEIEAAKATVDQAQARLDGLKAGPSPQSIAAAQANVAAAQANLRKAQTGPSADQIAAAKADLDNAEAQRRNAQSAYDQVRDLPDIASRPESLILEQATNQYNAAKARYDDLLRGPNAADVAAARAQLDRAQAELEAARQPASAADLAAAEAEVRRVRSQLELLLAGPKPEESRAAEADVAAAEAALAQAEAVFAETELRAPLGSTVAALSVVVGQQVAPGATVMRLADMDNWLIETRDLTELKIVGVQPGDKAVLAFDAVPGLELTGRVLRIESIGQNTQGDITYTVIVWPDRTDGRMRWNMTAKVIIEPGTTDGVVPQLPTPVVAVATRPPPTVEPATPVPASPTATSTTAPSPTATVTTAPSATATRQTARAVVTKRPAATKPTAAPRTVSAPRLLEPGEAVSLAGVAVFRWQPTAPLPAGAFYEVVWWNADEDPANARGLAAPTTNQQASANLAVMWESGQLRQDQVRWTVLIVTKNPYVRLLQPSNANSRTLVYLSPRPPEKTK